MWYLRMKRFAYLVSTEMCLDNQVMIKLIFLYLLIQIMPQTKAYAIKWDAVGAIHILHRQFLVII